MTRIRKQFTPLCIKQAHSRCPRGALSRAGQAADSRSGKQPRIKCEPLRLADGDSLEGRMGRVEQVVAFSRNDDARQREHC